MGTQPNQSKADMTASDTVDTGLGMRPAARFGRVGRLLRRVGPLLAIAVGLCLFFAFDLQRFVSLSMLEQHHEAMTAWVDNHAVLASVVFMAGYTAAVTLSIPGAVLLTITGGLMFGIVWGSILVILSATAGAVCVFLAARTALGDILRRKAGPWVERLEAGFRHNAFSYMLTLRLIPVVPFWLVNLLPAFFRVDIGRFALSTVIGIIPGSVVYVSLGNGAAAALKMGESLDLGVIFKPEILLPLIGLGLLALVPVFFRRRSLAANRAADSEAGAVPSPDQGSAPRSTP